MSDPFGIVPGTLAPDWSRADADPHVSPFTDLPTLDRCSHCGTALAPLTGWAVLDTDGVYHRPLCTDCKDRVPPWRPDDGAHLAMDADLTPRSRHNLTCRDEESDVTDRWDRSSGGNRFIPADSTRHDLAVAVARGLADLEHMATATGRTLDVAAITITTHRISNGSISVDVGGDLTTNPGATS